jgi:hypothetical protein
MARVGKSNGDGDEGGSQLKRVMARAERVMAMETKRISAMTTNWSMVSDVDDDHDQDNNNNRYNSDDQDDNGDEDDDNNDNTDDNNKALTTTTKSMTTMRTKTTATMMKTKMTRWQRQPALSAVAALEAVILVVSVRLWQMVGGGSGEVSGDGRWRRRLRWHRRGGGWWRGDTASLRPCKNN